MSRERILVVGGAGYIGSHMVKTLSDHGYAVTVFDNLSTGHREAVQWGELIVGDLLNAHALDEVFFDRTFRAVMHFSAKSLVGESMETPSVYYENNVTGTWHLLETMRRAGVNHFIFSSTAAIFGNPVSTPIDETHPKNPTSPYGRTKWIVEQMLSDYQQAYGLSSVCLRYFNAAGADPSGHIGESHEPETHLIPNILRSVLQGSAAPPLKLFGDDYDTRDGTCIRDYIHVNDLASAHLKALDFLDHAPGAHTFNLGNGTGFTVKEVIKAAETVVGSRIRCDTVERRPGDPAVLVANADKAQDILNWNAEWTDIGKIIKSAWHWHNNQRF